LHAPARAAPIEVEAGLTSIVVVSHDSGALLLAGVAAALAQQAPVEVIVIDNASLDGSPEALPPDARLRVLRNPDNPGFGAACNQGAALARGDALLFLNPDCALPREAVTTLRARLADDPDLGVLGAQLLNADGTPQAAARRRTPTPTRALRRALGLARDDLEMAPSAGSTPLEFVDAISGALMLLPRRVFDALGGFDPGYRLHCEDLDLCRRALQAGHRVAIATGVRVLHLKGTSSRRRPVWVEWQKHRGMLRYFHKFDAAQSPWWLRLAVPLGVWLRFPLAALRAALRA
jgi:N-acetylglucosaminyl-diphospho-decaprenol L-rhamnosyltransferase